MKALFLPIILVYCLLALPVQADESAAYGKSSLIGLRKFGVAIKVLCLGDLEQHQEVFLEHMKQRIQSRNIPVVPGGSATLKLLVTSIQSDDGFFTVHFSLQFHQSARLAYNNKLIDAPTWDAWKMGEYREEDLLQEVDDLTRLFMNDYISGN